MFKFNLCRLYLIFITQFYKCESLSRVAEARPYVISQGCILPYEEPKVKGVSKMYTKSMKEMCWGINDNLGKGKESITNSSICSD